MSRCRLVELAFSTVHSNCCYVPGSIPSLPKSSAIIPLSLFTRRLIADTEVKKTLNPDVFQEFPLQEKTVLSHNVAMYASP